MFANTDEASQSRFLHDVFTVVPPRYDLINHLMTWGLDGRWRRMAARECLAAKPGRVLDLCCGTGDLVLAIARLGGEKIEVLGIDYSQPMLAKAERKAGRSGDSQRLSFVCGDIARIPFPDAYFDCIGISFAFRNLTYQNPLAGRYLAEVLRVLKNGGRFVILESSQPHPRPGFIKWLHHLYVRHFVFRLGWLVSGDKESYRYLADSVVNFYGAEELKKLLMEAGFGRVSFRRLFLGAAAIHVAVKV
jgi:demethylmenaquinone methyltransferase/2-methoxy-6-polyprenyl-1,4-benzoquinol methylase